MLEIKKKSEAFFDFWTFATLFLTKILAWIGPSRHAEGQSLLKYWLFCFSDKPLKIY